MHSIQFNLCPEDHAGATREADRRITRPHHNTDVPYETLPARASENTVTPGVVLFPTNLVNLLR
jgi:hypothetical protein